jgi:hypothetical protein
MAYQKYITINGKKYGPYYYQSYRDKNGVVRKRYVKREDMEDVAPKETKISSAITKTKINSALTKSNITSGVKKSKAIYDSKNVIVLDKHGFLRFKNQLKNR